MLRCALAVVVLLLFTACDQFGLGGAQRYKPEINAALAVIRADIQEKGEVNPKSVERLRKIEQKYKADYGEKQSYMHLGLVISAIEQYQAAAPDEKAVYLQGLEGTMSSLETLLLNESS
jgi:hypothetical protein